MSSLASLHSVGSHFIVGLSTTVLGAEERELLQTLRPAGIIIFKHNIAEGDNWPLVLGELIADAKEAANRGNFLVSIDHEGGRVHRLKAPVTHFPAALHWQQRAKDVGAAVGRELRALGFNLNFAPVADVWSEPENTVIAHRALSKEPHEVARYSVEYAQGQESCGVLACAKHFPGHGGTKIDSHVGLPTLDLSRKELEERELIPFRAMIQSGIRLVMTSHVLYPAVDKSLPATLSSLVIDGLLRGELDYQHAVISDALDMGAMNAFPAEEVGTRYIKAGGDLLCVAQPKTKYPAEHALGMAKHMIAALVDGSLPDAVEGKSLERIEDVFSYLQKITEQATENIGLACLGCEEHEALRRDIQPRTA